MILQAGVQPLWFDLGNDGPRQILSPSEAELKPFEPWPEARYITALLPRKEQLVMAVNREGFLAAVPGNGNAAGLTGILRAADPVYWNNYTVSALFLLDDTPAALLYRNDFFSDLKGEPPVPPVRGLFPGSPLPAPMKVPAFETLTAEGWEIDGLRRGPDSRWYFRGIQRKAEQPGIRYFSMMDFNSPGEAVSLGAYRNSAALERVSQAPAVLAKILGEAFALMDRNNLNIAAVVSPDFQGPRYFAPDNTGAGEGEILTELSGFYRSGAALIIFPDGRGIYSLSGGENSGIIETGTFDLPPLPEGFVYTGLGCIKTALFALWEERQEGSLGAAGFMVMALPPFFHTIY
ncbi:hypothetical protein AGMMS49928_06600 [Spirochaetia bacterium]|nr:hypothetical protein AGMMS49928_06600 [Spirochaetia bacterium]